MIPLHIPLCGIIEVDEESLISVIGMAAIGQKTFDPELYGLLVDEKFSGRYHSINDVVRVKFGLVPLRPHVKRFSDEGEENGAIDNEA